MFWNGFQKFLRVYFTRYNWTNRKIAFVSILIAVSVVFVLIMTSILPFLIWPSLKISVGGLPIKITGYIFGPFIGMITGIVSDTLTFAFKPTYWHWAYMLSFAITGFVPGVVGYFMNRRWRGQGVFEEQNKDKINKLNVFLTMSLLALIAIGFSAVIYFFGSEMFDTSKIATLSDDEKPIITNKWVFLALALSGIGSMGIGIILMMFFLKKSTINTMLPIIAFSAILEIIVTPLIALGDISVLGTKQSAGFITVVSTHFLMSPVKIWVNLAVIFITYKIISPLIFNKQANGWN